MAYLKSHSGRNENWIPTVREAGMASFLPCSYSVPTCRSAPLISRCLQASVLVCLDCCCKMLGGLSNISVFSLEANGQGVHMFDLGDLCPRLAG